MDPIPDKGKNIVDERQQDMGPEFRSCPASECNKPEMAADSAVKKVFAILGVDVDKPEDVDQFRQGLRFGEAMHKYAKYGMLVMVGVFSAAAAGAMVLGALEKIKGYVTGQGG